MRYQPDQWLREFVSRYLPELVLAWMLLTSVLIRYLVIPLYQSDDYTGFLLPWVNAYRGVGLREALTLNVSNYYIPYNLFLIFVSRLPLEPYIPIAMLSILADYGIAWMIRKLVLLTTNDPLLARRSLLLSVMLPFVFLNSAVWKQCDAVYVFFILWSMVRLFEEKPLRSFLLLGVALSFKLQTVFVLPYYLYRWLVRKDHSIFHYILLVAVYLVTGLPAVWAGRPFAEVFMIYREQMHETGNIVKNLPNLYYLGLPPRELFEQAGILLTLAVLLLIVCVLYRYRENILPAHELLVCAFLVWTCVMFLPGMHERYDYPVTLLVSVTALCLRNKRMLLVAFFLNLIDVMDYSWFLFHWSLIEPSKLTIAFLFLYVCTGYELWNRLHASGT